MWPPVFLLLMRVTRGSRAALLGILAGVAAASALLMAALCAPGEDQVTVVDLHAYLNPNGEFVNAIAGVEPIRGDGIHFSAPGADVVARWRSPKLVRVARQDQHLVATANASIGSASPPG